MSFLDRARAPIAALVALDMALILVNGRAQISNDTWLNLVTGREIASSGLIRTHTLTVLAHGMPVCDQQWLAHLAWLGIHHLGGFVGLLLTRAALSALAVALACALAVRRGATPGRTALTALLMVPLIAANAAVRAQAFGELLFVAVIGLLASDQEHASRRVWGIVPLAVLWTNLHGSVLLGLVFAFLAVPSRWIDARRGRTSGAGIPRDVALALAVGLAVFASPYATMLPQYFHTMVGNPAFRANVTEYSRPDLATNPWVFVVAVLVLAVVARARRSLTTFDLGLTCALVFFGLSAVRYGVFLALGLLVVLPRALDAALPSGFLMLDKIRGTRIVAITLAGCALLAGIHAASSLDRSIARDFPPATAAETSRRAGPHGMVLASENYADVLLWYRPELRGRVAFDARLDLLSNDELAWVAALQSGRSENSLAPYDVAAIDQHYWHALVQRLAASPMWRSANGDPAVRLFVRAD